MTLLVVSPDYASHARPLIALATEWKARGERVVVATGPAVAPLVADAGLEYTRLALGRGSNAAIARPGDQPAGEDANLRAFFAATRRGMLPVLTYQAERRATDLLWEPVSVGRRTIRVVDEIRPDAILVDHVALGATVGLRAAGIPYVDIVLGHPTQLPVGDETFGVPTRWPSAFRPDPSEVARLRDTASRVARAVTAAYNDALRALSGRAATVDDAFAAPGPLVLLNYPATLHEPARTAALPPAHAFIGPAVRSERAEAPVDAWLAREPSRPIVLVSFGTFLSARDDVLARVADALRGLDVRVAMAIGDTDPRRLGPIPPDWLVASHLPQVAILARAGAFVTHGGNNSVTEAAFHGVPMLVLPFSTDQFDGAAALEAAGLGLAADPNVSSAPALRAAVEHLVDDPPPGVARLAAELTARAGPATARATVAAWMQGLLPIEAPAPLVAGSPADADRVASLATPPT